MSNFEISQTPPSDAILGLTQAYNESKHPHKVNLGVGAYRTNEGKPLIFKAVQEAEKQCLSEIVEGHRFKEYLPMAGDQEFLQSVQKLIVPGFENVTGSIQTAGGTGALKIAIEFCKYATLAFVPHDEYPASQLVASNKKELPTVWCSSPTWPNHQVIAHYSGLDTKDYPYFNNDTLAVHDTATLLQGLEGVKANDIVLLHAVGHNPTGADISEEAMEKVLDLIQSKNAVCIMDIAYQGFVSGDLDKDLWAIKLALKRSMKLIIAQSFSKNIGMYGERLGVCHVRTASAGDAVRARGFMERISRAIVSSPPRHASDICAKIFTTPALYQMWSDELWEVAQRIVKMRETLRSLLEASTKKDWSHVTSQRGMFAYTGLEKEQVQTLKEKDAIFMSATGRISVAGLRDDNVEYVAAAIARVCNQSC